MNDIPTAHTGGTCTCLRCNIVVRIDAILQANDLPTFHGALTELREDLAAGKEI